MKKIFIAAALILGFVGLAKADYYDYNYWYVVKDTTTFLNEWHVRGSFFVGTSSATTDAKIVLYSTSTFSNERIKIVDGDVHITTTSGTGYGIRFPDGSRMTTANTGSTNNVSDNGDVYINCDDDNNGSGDIIFRKAGATEFGRFYNAGNLSIIEAALSAGCTIGTTLNVTGAGSMATINTGHGNFEVGQDLLNTSSVTFLEQNLTKGCTIGTILNVTGASTIGSTLGVTGAGSMATLDTGQGAGEFYGMDQYVLTTSTPTFGGCLINGKVGIHAATPENVIDFGTVASSDGIRMGQVDTGLGATNKYIGLNGLGAAGVFDGGCWISINGDNTGNYGLTLQTQEYGVANHQVNITYDGDVGIGTASPASELEVNGFTKLGSDSPAIKCIELSTTTASTEGGSASVNHGLTPTNILSVMVKIQSVSSDYGTFANEVDSAGYQYNYYHNGTSVIVKNHATNSENILNKPVTILIWYKE